MHEKAANLLQGIKQTKAVLIDAVNISVPLIDPVFTTFHMEATDKNVKKATAKPTAEVKISGSKEEETYTDEDSIAVKSIAISDAVAIVANHADATATRLTALEQANNHKLIKTKTHNDVAKEKPSEEVFSLS